MKHSKGIAIMFTVVNIILIAVCGILFFRTDRKEPEFKFQVSSLIYEDGMDQQKLIENITASDNRDGDVTDRIVIEKIVESTKESSVMVFYAVSDKAGNAAKISRAFPAKITPQETAAEVTPEEKQADGMLPEENQADESIDKITDETSEMQETETDPEEKDKAKAEEADTEGADTEKADTEKADTEEADTEETDTEANTEKSDAENDTAEEPEQTGGIPVLTLKKSEVTTVVGVAPAWVDVIGSLTDDADSYETLFHNLSVSKYDVNKAGTYKVVLTTKDSAGNKSDPVALTIHVK